MARNRATVRTVLWTLLPALLGACSVPLPETRSIAQPAPVDTGEGAAVRAEPAAAAEASETPFVRVAAVGDMMLGTDFPKHTLPDDDGAGFLHAVTPLLSAADIAFGNLEGVLQDAGEPVKKCHNPRHCYLFRSPSRYAAHFKAAGFDVLSLANNHARDFGEAGRSATMAALKVAGVHHSGRQGDIASWEIKGLKVALIAFAPFGGSHDMLDTEAAVSRVSELASKYDLVFVSMHAGAEGEAAMHLPFASEQYHGENRGDAVRFAHAMIDAGADLVLGHGPHVPRALELYRGRLVAYSLGNFATYYGIRVSGANGLAPVLEVELSATGELRSGQIHSFRQMRPDGPRPDEMLEASRLMARLTAEDFPDGELIIDEQGGIRLRPPSTAPPIAHR